MSRCRSKTRVRLPLKRHEFLSAHWFTHPNLAPEDHIISKSCFLRRHPSRVQIGARWAGHSVIVYPCLSRAPPPGASGSSLPRRSR